MYASVGEYMFCTKAFLALRVFYTENVDDTEVSSVT